MRLTSRATAHPKGTSLVLLVMCLSASTYAADTPASVQRSSDASVLIAPTQGRPVFVAPGAGFTVVLLLPDAAARAASLELVASRPVEHRHLLDATHAPQSPGTREQRYTVRVPPDTPERTYDLVITWPDGELTGRHAVAVQKLARRVRLVHLSDMDVGEIGVTDFDDRLVADVNLIAPTLIVLTGDLVDAACPDPAAAWSRAADFLARFDAPVLAACGDNDDLASYSQHLAPSPIGALDLGPYRGLVLYDVPAKPIRDDAQQLRWVEQQLGGGPHAVAFIVAHDERPNLLHHWQAQSLLTRMVRAGRLGLWFAGGHRDWDGAEYRSIVEAAGPLLYFRTHQSSTATRDGATGVSHFRVVDLDGERATVYGPPSSTGVAGSIPVGGLSVAFDAPNDGSQASVAVAVSSVHSFRLNNLLLRVLLLKDGDAVPACAGGRLARVTDLPGLWECHVRFDLPDKGARQIVVTTGSAPPLPPVDVYSLLPDRLVLRPAVSDDGVQYLSAGEVPALLQLQNHGSEPVEVTPAVRLDGEPVAYQVVGAGGPMASVYRLRLAPTQVLTLQLDLSAVRVAPGRRELQVYLLGGPAWEPTCAALEIEIAR